MCSRNHRYGVLSDINAQFEAARIDVGEVIANEILALMGDIEENAIEATLFHLEVDGTSNDIARRQFCAIIMLRHEAGAIGQAKQTAFTPHRL